MPSYYEPVLHRQCVADDDPLRDLFTALGRQWQNTEVSDHDWPEVSLSFVRTVAAGAGQGVLWGGDVFCEDWGERL